MYDKEQQEKSRDSTSSKQLATVAIICFQFGLHHVIICPVKLSALYQPCIIVSLSIFG